MNFLTNLRLAQLWAVFRLELRKTFLSRRGLWIYLLAFSPAVLFAGHSFLMLSRHRPCDFGNDTNVFALNFQVFYLRLCVFFGCLGIFMNLFRGEILDKSLHYYFLAPVRREVVLAGKFLAGLCVAVCTFCLSTLVQFLALYAHFDREVVSEYLWRGNGLWHLAAYLGVTAMACLGYGSVFLAAGILIRNPIIPAGVILVWESADPVLPGFLDKLSVIYYLRSLCPISIPPYAPPPLNLLAVNPDPIAPVLAVAGLFALATVVLLWSGSRIRKMEISYGTD